MTTKTSGRRNRDKQRAKAVGGGRKVLDRKKSTQCWYELKVVHMRSQQYVEKTAALFDQYRNPLVLAKIAKNGDGARWQELQLSVPVKMGRLGADFQKLWDMHKDIKRLCLSNTDLNDAYRIFDLYQQFDAEFFEEFQEVISELSTIFNKALKQLLEAQDKIIAQQAADAIDVNVVTDVEVNEDKASADVLPSMAVSLDEPAAQVPDSMLATAKAVEESINIDPSMGEGLIRPQL